MIDLRVTTGAIAIMDVSIIFPNEERVTVAT